MVVVIQGLLTGKPSEINGDYKNWLRQ